VIAKLNDLKGGKLVPGSTLRIPQINTQLPDKVLMAAARVDRPETDVGKHQRQLVYRVRAGETLSSIARRHGLSVAQLARLNDLNTQDRVVQGQRLVLKVVSRHYRGEGAVSGKRVTYTVRNGDTVYSISRQFQVSVPKLKSWNGLNQHHQIRAGQRLVMYVDPGKQQG
jgi:membrane-bound lytic murein transglycosylase D